MLTTEERQFLAVIVWPVFIPELNF